MKKLSAPGYQSQDWTRELPDNCPMPADVTELLEFWSDRSCGLACASSAIELLTGNRVSQIALFNACVREGGYAQQGWKHDELAKTVARYGVQAHARAFGLQSLTQLLERGNLIIASVTHKLPEDGRRGGHLILLHGVSEKEGIVLIDFMDPSAWGRDNKSVTLERFNASFTGRGIIISGD